MKNDRLFWMSRYSNIELQLLRSFLREKKMKKVALETPVDNEKVWANYIKVKQLIDGGKK